ncbi:MAG: hypothetical protein R3A78_12450 [Polyangiales bacterium]
MPSRIAHVAIAFAGALHLCAAGCDRPSEPSTHAPTVATHAPEQRTDTAATQVDTARAQQTPAAEVIPSANAPAAQAIPEENARDRIEPAARPDGAGAQEDGRRLFEAIVRDDPSLAATFFFPRDAFAHVKAIPDPDRYWQRLFARYEKDIHTLHAALPEGTTPAFERLEVVRRGGWVNVGDEGNALPYWAARHNVLHYTVNGKPQTLEVRVLITWGNRWYVTHLSEFH